MVQIALGVAAVYGLIALLGGVMGYLKAGSRASLIAGSASGLLLMGSALLGLSYPSAGLVLASVVSLALVVRFARSALKKQRAGGVAYVMIGAGLAVLVTSGLALA